MRAALVNGRVLTPDGFIEDGVVLIEGERILAVAAERVPKVSGAEVVDLEGGFLLPGFIDVQVNGGGGVLFNDEPTVEGVAAIGEAHRAYGTTGFLPTLISDDLEVMRRAVAAVDAAIEAGVPGVLGIHLEGPVLNPTRRGTHDPKRLRRFDEEVFTVATSLRRGRILLTVAPEATAPEILRRLTAAGVVVAAGHTDATYEQARDALGAGVRGFTHLFNAMSPLTSRAPGAVGAALDDAAAWCGLIVDGVHVAPAVVRIALRCKGADRLILVTDAMPTVGSPARTFQLHGRAVSVRDGVCVDEDGVLSGSHLDMAQAVRNVIAFTGCSLADAARMASNNPASFMGLTDRGRLEAGGMADLVLLDADLQVRRTWCAGRSPVR